MSPKFIIKSEAPGRGNSGTIGPERFSPELSLSLAGPGARPDGTVRLKGPARSLESGWPPGSEVPRWMESGPRPRPSPSDSGFAVIPGKYRKPCPRAAGPALRPGRLLIVTRRSLSPAPRPAAPPGTVRSPRRASRYLPGAVKSFMIIKLVRPEGH
eukprot:682486-Hanusia_phi.AAC.1